MSTPRLPVLSGLDSCPESMCAVDAAAAEASRRRVPLRLVSPVAGGPDPAAVTLSDWLPVDDLTDLLRRTIRRLHGNYPDLEVSTGTYPGDLANLLVDESRHATPIVVGPAHTGGFDKVLHQWLAYLVVTHAHCPVLVARPSGTGVGSQPVVVGVDGSEHSTAAVRLAFEEAMLRQVSLRAVHIHCIAPEADAECGNHVGYGAATAQARAEQLIHDTTARWAHTYPDVKIETEPMYAPDVPAALLDAATTADLVVVGTRGHSAITSLLLGSTSRALVERAACPVLLTHARM
jgi:nucleotide-binding universal stress UspA family protein